MAERREARGQLAGEGTPGTLEGHPDRVRTVEPREPGDLLPRKIELKPHVHDLLVERVERAGGLPHEAGPILDPELSVGGCRLRSRIEQLVLSCQHVPTFPTDIRAGVGGDSEEPRPEGAAFVFPEPAPGGGEHVLDGFLHLFRRKAAKFRRHQCSQAGVVLGEDHTHPRTQLRVLAGGFAAPDTPEGPRKGVGLGKSRRLAAGSFGSSDHPHMVSLPFEGIVAPHLTPMRLTAADRTPDESEHLSACAECRIQARRAADFAGSSVGDASLAPASSTRLEPGTVVEKYVVEGVLGEGGMAVVYRARHSQLGSFHAIKVLTVPSRDVRERLLREGRGQAGLKSPNVVPVTDVIDVGGAPGLVMELVEGPTLAELLRQGPVSLADVDTLARGILAGVSAAHHAGLIHRDLKPANILVARTPVGLVAKVTDFGLVKALDPALPDSAGQTRSSALLGTPRYMSPEQIDNPAGVDERSDIFSLGALFYELLTGRPPFQGDGLLSLFRAIADGLYPAIRESRPETPDRMVRAIDAALQVDPARRVPDVDTLARLWAGDAEKSPAAPAPAAPAAPVARRWVPAILALLTLVLFGGAAWTVWPSPVPPPPPTVDYIPLAAGNSWRYSVTDPENGRSLGEKLLTVGQAADIGGLKAGVTAFPLLREDGAGSSLRWIRLAGQAIVWEHDEWRGKDGALTKSVYYEPFRVRVDQVPEHRLRDATWTETFDEVVMDIATGEVKVRNKVEVTWTIEATNEEVTVPAGTFSCIRVRRRSGREDQIYWFADGVGKVKEDSPPKEYEELIEYHLADGP